MERTKLAVVGCGFWSEYQCLAWKEMSDQVEIVALCDRDLQKAESLAKSLGVARFYDDLETMLKQESPGLVDVITDPDSHAPLVKACADHQVPVICQKPMGPSYDIAKDMVSYCEQKKTPFFIHENFRWQTPIRKVKELLSQEIIGKPFKSNIKFCSSFPVYDNQPLLAELEQFILTDVGTHILDIGRFLFGEAQSLYCQIQRVNPVIRGEDVANVFMVQENGVHTYAEMSYASRLEHESFPETFILIEGTKGSIYLGPNCRISCTTEPGTTYFEASPPVYDWSLPAYALVHSSIVSCNRDILTAIRESKQAETIAQDNLKTIKLVFDAYKSAELNQTITYKEAYG